MESTFIGFDKTASFSYETLSGVPCTRCANHCNRSIVSFSTGGSWTTGNRCERGEADPLPRIGGEEPANLVEERCRMLVSEYRYTPVREPQGKVIGLPRVLEFYDSMPFWSTFFRALGYEVRISDVRTLPQYERGLQYVASDTICFPAKLVHAHVLQLCEAGVDRVFFPYVMHQPAEGPIKSSCYMCSVLQGYPMVVRNSQNPESQYYPLAMDTPTFHFFSRRDRRRQICAYASETLHIDPREALEAYGQAEKALLMFRRMLREKTTNAIKQSGDNTFVAVLAGRPYQFDPMVEHGVSRMLTRMGVPVVPLDGLEGLDRVDLRNTRIEITNNFHTRILAAADLVARTPGLQLVQLVSFGCGHDAVLCDEVVRIMHEVGGKSPLQLKVDESAATGALGIRLRSFVESVKPISPISPTKPISPIPDPFPTKYTKPDKRLRTLFIPNISREVSVMLDAIFASEGFRVQTVPVGGIDQIHTGKRYSHNDICFPAQMVIGELIEALRASGLPQEEMAVGMVKFQCDCRMSNYAALLRKALDAAGYDRVPVMTTDPTDSKQAHPGVHLLGVRSVLKAVWGFQMMDILQDLARKIRPYELVAGSTDRLLAQSIEAIAADLAQSIHAARRKFDTAVRAFAALQYNRSVPKPRVLVTGELLVTYHPGSNFNIERYLEQNGMEVVFPRVTDQLRKDFLASMEEIRRFHADIPKYPFAVSKAFDLIQDNLEKTALLHPLYRKAAKPAEIYEGVRHIIPLTLSCGEGWLMAAEIEHYAREGVTRFVILQPFGCLPNHISGRGVVKRLKAAHPGISILPLDLDPDTSYANVENRLQMLIMANSK